MTYEEMTKKYPIGTVIKYDEPKWVKGTFITQGDLDIYLTKYEKVELVDDHTVRCLTKRVPRTMVSGYVFDGCEWHPAECYSDEWFIIDIDEDENEDN